MRAQAATDSRIISNAIGTPGKACIVEFKSYMKMVFPEDYLYDRSFINVSWDLEPVLIDSYWRINEYDGSESVEILWLDGIIDVQ